MQAVLPKVLIVDDDPGLVRLMKGALRADYDISWVTSGAEAIQWLSANAADLLLLDLKLSDCEATEVIAKIEEHGWDAPFIIITGQGDEHVAVEMMKRGALDYLVKEVNFLDALPGVVQRALTHSANEKRLRAAEEALRENQALTKAVLDSLPAYIAVLDCTGKILAVNDPWKAYAESSKRKAFSMAIVGANYLEVCRAASRVGEPCATDIAEGVEAVLRENPKSSRALEYHCTALGGWYLLTVTPLRGRTEGAVVAHGDISAQKKLEAEVLNIADRERQRVSADLHDGICQELTGIAFAAAALHRKLGKADRETAERIRELEEMINMAVGHTRAIARGLSPIVPDGYGLMYALQRLAQTASNAYGIECRFKCETPVEIDLTRGHELYLIAQEAVSNAMRHSGATTVQLTLDETEDGIRVSVKDDGVGVSAHSSDQKVGIGLDLMKYRAGLVRGQLSVKSERGRGTEVMCLIPRE